jgi:hypothetical protein
VKVRYDEGLASHIALESCACHREVLGEGLTEVRAGQPLSRETMNIPERRCFCTCGRQQSRVRYASALTPGVVVDPGMYASPPRGSREISNLAWGQRCHQVRIGKVRSRSR